MYKNLDILADRIVDISRDKGWAIDSRKHKYYIFLEVAEFVEALRGKGDPVDELGDVLFCVLSTAAEHGIKPSDAIKKMKIKFKGYFL